MSTEKLPQWQADRLATLLDALTGFPISDAQRASLAWLAGSDAATVETIVALIKRARSQSQVAGEREMKDFTEADLCDWAGIDPGRDPRAALLAHLQAHDPNGGRLLPDPTNPEGPR